MKLTLTSPRNRPGHLASIPSPEGCEAAFLNLKGSGENVVAERDPGVPLYHAVLPAMEAGQELSFEAETADDAPASTGISFDQADHRIEISLGGSDLMTFHHGTDYPKPVINPILTPGGANMLRQPTAAWSEGEHPWQRGLTLMQGSINGVDCWNERDRETFGRTEQDAMTVHHGPVSLVIASHNSWYQGNRKLMTDSRWYRVFASERSAAVLDIALTLKASEGSLTFGYEGGRVPLHPGESDDECKRRRNDAQRLRRCRRKGMLVAAVSLDRLLRPCGERGGRFRDLRQPREFPLPDDVAHPWLRSVRSELLDVQT